MPDVLTIQLDRPIAGAAVQQNCDAQYASQEDAARLQVQKAQLAQTCSNLRNIVETLAGMESVLFSRYKDEIINLAVEISRKVLAHRIEQDDYKIADVIKQALEDSPVQNEIVIRLNPKDYAQVEKLSKDGSLDFAKGVTFVSDAAISPAQCLLETPKGIVESFIDEHLEKISAALKKTG
ncbi:MAG: FliH/SctL family protein [Phycisphaerae bacterium]|jgi:flagellar biosynthesis/type III secretory pathway protein FliH